MDALKRTLKPYIPRGLLSLYHLALSFFAALVYGFPSRNIMVIGVTGTKGKSSTVEYVNAIFEAAGHTTALLGTIRIKIGARTERNLMRMTMPGRFYVQRFLDRAARAGCTVAIIEMTSEGARQHRHRFIELDALIFTNLAPEHIESHGSYEAYAEAKLSIGHQLARSRKRPRFMVANANDALATRFLALPIEHPLPFSLDAVEPVQFSEQGSVFHFEDTEVRVPLPGKFNAENALGAAVLARAGGIHPPTIAKGIASVTRLPGRTESINAGQDFLVVVDYAHTPDSLKAIYSAYPERHRVCVLGATGGGRDLWKRPVMGAIAEKMCAEVILTNEDPYDEDPRSIVAGLERGMHKPHDVIMDRRLAIRDAVARARKGDAVIITGKGTDPTIQGPRGTSVPWNDAAVAREEIAQILKEGSAR